jgi:pyroglutamyl-peptidase
MPTILITGFNRFPSAPFNPTAALVRALARERRPALAGVSIVTHVFRTSFAAVDRDLPLLMGKHRPDAMLMFGLAARTAHLRIETVARNANAQTADADGHTPALRVIAKGGPRQVRLITPAVRLLAAARTAGVPARPSSNAGRYLCNYLCWRVMEAIDAPSGPRLAAFIHVPIIRREAVPLHRIKRRRATMSDLIRAGRNFLVVVAHGTHH